MSLRLVTGLLFAAILMNLRSVETAEDDISASGGLLSSVWSIIEIAMSVQRGIYPGTKWCGNGDMATHDTDYGINRHTDICCRKHDGCENYVEVGETKYGLTNRGNLTVMGCDCDQLLMECLINVSTSTAESIPALDKQAAQTVGFIFFNVNRQKCLEEEYPLICVEKGLEGLCNHCVSDTNQTKVWNLVDNPPFPLQ